MRSRDLRHGLVALLFAPLFVVACGADVPPSDTPPPPPPVPDPPPAQVAVATDPTPTAAPTTVAVATAEPTSAPVATSEPAPAPTASANAGPAGANLQVGLMTVDGLTLKDLACRADGLGLLGSMIVVGSIAKKKAALDACGKGTTRIEWKAAKGSVATATAKGDNAKMDACVAKVLKGAAAPFEGECAATLTTGQ